MDALVEVHGTSQCSILTFHWYNNGTPLVTK